MLLNYHIGRVVLSSLCVGAFGAAGFRWCSFCRLHIHHQELATVLMKYHIGGLVLSSLCVGAFGAAGFRWCSFAGSTFSKLLMMDILMSETC